MLSPFASLPLSSLFARDYAAADAAFCRLVAALDDTPTDTLLPIAGPQGEALHTRHFWWGHPDARRVLVLISGTHGVEGLAGSAIQQDFLTQALATHWQPPAETAVLLIHLLNPWGCAWARRCEQQGIDLNRNFVDFSQPLPTNPGYHQLRDALRATHHAERDAAMRAFATAHGQTALEVAVSGGQYEDPDGPWYGGTQPALARQYLTQLMAEHALAERQLAVIDLHTGLGPFGHGEIICDHPADSGSTATARAWYGDAVTLPALGTSFSAPKLGLMDYAWHAIMGDDSCFVTLEFGTGSLAQLFHVLLDDHAFHALSAEAQTPEQARRLRHAMLAHFYPDNPHWQARILAVARSTITQALEGLALSSHHGQHA